MTVRSRRFAWPTLVTAANTWQTIYTVPSGRTARFSLVTALHTSGATRLVAIGVGDGSGVRGTCFYENVPTVSSRSVLQGLVLNPDEKLMALCDVANVLYVAGFGSLLEGAPS